MLLRAVSLPCMSTQRIGIPHLHEELQDSGERVVVHTKYGDVVGGRACTGAATFLGKLPALDSMYTIYERSDRTCT